jgi:hypothetical protein
MIVLTSPDQIRSTDHINFDYQEHPKLELPTR